MPERWEDEIRKLRSIAPAADLRDRVDDGPHGEPPAPTRQRVIAAITAIVVFVGAGAFAVRVIGTGGAEEDPQAAASTDAVVIELLGGNAPTATLRFGDVEQRGLWNEYTWCGGDDGCVTGIGDFATYPPVTEFAVAPPGTQIAFTGDGTVERLRVTDELGEPVADADGAAVPDRNGRYVLEFDATWADGSAHFYLGIEALDGPASAPDVLRVDCGDGSARTNTSVVRTSPNGLRLEFTGTDAFSGFQVVTPEGTPPEEIFGAGGGFSRGSTTFPISPGRWEIGCTRGDEPAPADELTAGFELVDPDDHYAPLPACEATETAFTVPGLEGTPPDEVAAQVLSGVREGDRLRDAGYGAETFKAGLTYVVDRDGGSVARLVLTGEPPWEGTLSACPDSGIALAEVATPPDEQEVPDVLVVRCEGFGPAVGSTTVRLQADGLHVEATNVADAASVVVGRADDGDVSSVTAFDEVTETTVVEMGPGKVFVACPTTQQEGDPAEGPEDDLPEGYVVVTVLPFEG
jgi:hypothetical protein